MILALRAIRLAFALVLIHGAAVVMVKIDLCLLHTNVAQLFPVDGGTSFLKPGSNSSKALATAVVGGMTKSLLACLPIPVDGLYYGNGLGLLRRCFDLLDDLPRQSILDSLAWNYEYEHSKLKISEVMCYIFAVLTYFGNLARGEVPI